MDPFYLPGFFPSKPLYDPFVDNAKGVPGHILFPIFLCITATWILFFVLLVRRTTFRPSKRNTATILVLGDIGRSPRMMYHASSLSKHHIETWLIGYGETTPISGLISNENKNVHILSLIEPPRILGKLPWIFRAPIRIIYQIYSIIYLIIWETPINTEYLIVQNPPSIPTLAIAQFIGMNTGSKLIIDWHNTGYSILAMRLGIKSPIVKLARWIEKYFGQSAYAHLFVTEALREYLVKEWKLEGRKVVLHDRPPSHFKPTSPRDQHELFTKLLPTLEPPLPPSLIAEEENSTLFTSILSNEAILRSDRPALVVSSTSWTADEDFSLLITALDEYQNAINSGSQEELPKLIVLITGKGSLRSGFEKIVLERESTIWKDIVVRCVFLPSEDYPLLLGSADLGVSLHTSSSGRDLPMKVVDMFGSGIPVLAKNFACIDELVKDGKNGKVFESGKELGEQLIRVLKGFPKSSKLDSLKKYFDRTSTVEKSSSPSGERAGNDWSTWDENWDKVIYEGLLNKPKK